MNWWVFVKCESKSSQLRTKNLNYFSLCALNLFNTRVSQFELNNWNKWTFPRHSNLLKCTCILHFYFKHSFLRSHFKLIMFVSVCMRSLYPLKFSERVYLCSFELLGGQSHVFKNRPSPTQVLLGVTRPRACVCVYVVCVCVCVSAPL